MNKELLSVVKEMSFHDLLNLYVDAKAGGHRDFMDEMAPVDRPLVSQLEEKLNEIIEYFKNL